MVSHISLEDSDDDFDRARDCGRAMELAFAKLLSDAVVEGWREIEVALVLADIADEHVLRLAKKAKLRKFN